MRIIRFLFILTSILLLTSCSSISTSLDKESNRLIDEIPLSFDSNITLPSPNNNYSIQYFKDGTPLANNVLPFTQTRENQEVEIKFILEYKNESKEYSFTIIQEGNEEKYKQYIIEVELQNIITTLDETMPTLQTHDITLPTFNNTAYQVEYKLINGSLSDSRILYNFPTVTTSNSLEVVITGEFDTIFKTYEFDVATVDELEKIPRIDINTLFNSEIDSKYYYTRATFILTDFNNPDNSIEAQQMNIRLRGNSTLWTPKKSYKIKFDEKTNVLSSYKEKDWVLLANYMDQTLVRNDVAFYLSQQLNFDFTPSYQHVDVYVNGEYQGNYLLTDQIEVTNDRVDIEENTTNTNTGFLIEYDLGLFRDEMEDSNYFIVDDIPFTIKSPDIEDAHYREDQKEYISSYMEQLFRTLKKQGNYHYLIDEASFIDWYIVNEVFKNVDSGYSSVYFYKDANDVLKMGPVWDFDLSSGQYGHLSEEFRGPTGIYTALSYKNIIIYYLMQYPEFRENVKIRYNEIYQDILQPLPDMVYSFSQDITLSRYNNFQKWDIIGKDNEWYTSPEIYELKTYDEQLVFLHDFLEQRIEWLYNEFNTY